MDRLTLEITLGERCGQFIDMRWWLTFEAEKLMRVSERLFDRLQYSTVQVGLVPHPHQNNTSILSFSTHNNSTTIALIDKAIAGLKLHVQDKDFSIQGIAKKHGVVLRFMRKGHCVCHVCCPGAPPSPP
jgi:hypothetical protein